MMLHFIKKNNFQKGNQSGFTLIELMVSSTIFMAVMLMAMGSLIVAMNGMKKAQALRVSMDNVNFAMETMSRNLRTGMDYYCTTSVILDNLSEGQSQDCKDGAGVIAFKPANGGTVNVPARISYNLNGGKLQRCESGLTGCSDLVADNVTVRTLVFYVNGSNPSDSIQPSVYIKMKGSVLVKGVPTDFAIQTMASQRVVY